MVGEGRPRSRQILLDLHPGIEAPIFSTSFEVAELTKLADKSFHALKVAFANEVGRFALSSGISPSEVFGIIQADTKLNLSSAYLRPGGAFGGPCLTKDVRALAASMDNAGVTAPVLGHINESKASHANFLVSEIERRLAPRSRVLLLGLSLKPGTDDVRESPFLALAEQLLSRGHALSIYDPDLCGDGASRGRMSLPSHLSAYVLPQLPAELAFDLVVVLRHDETVLIADTPAAMADEIVRLYEDADLWQRVSDNGYRFCMDRFSLAAGARKLLPLVDSLIAQTRASAAR